MTDTAKVLDIINNAKQMVTDAVEKVWRHGLVLNIIMLIKNELCVIVEWHKISEMKNMVAIIDVQKCLDILQYSISR